MTAGFLDKVVPEDQLLAVALVGAKMMSQLDLTAHHNTKLRVRDQLLVLVDEAVKKEF